MEAVAAHRMAGPGLAAVVVVAAGWAVLVETQLLRPPGQAANPLRLVHRRAIAVMLAGRKAGPVLPPLRAQSETTLRGAAVAVLAPMVAEDTSARLGVALSTERAVAERVGLAAVYTWAVQEELGRLIPRAAAVRVVR